MEKMQIIQERKKQDDANKIHQVLGQFALTILSLRLAMVTKIASSVLIVLDP
jgi:hypothetical protein